MGRIIRGILYLLLSIVLICQIPTVQHQIVKRFLPNTMQVSEMKSYGLFPIYIYIPVLSIKQEGKDFISIKNGALDLRYFFLRRQIAFDADQLIIYKTSPVTVSDKKQSLREQLDQLKNLTIFHDFNIGSLQYKDCATVLFDYKIDWDLKRDRLKLYAKQNGQSAYPDRVEIEGIPNPYGIHEGQLKVVKDSFCMTGTFHLKDWTIKADLTLNQKDVEIGKLQQTINMTDVDTVHIPQLKIFSPFFQWAGMSDIKLNPVDAILKNENFFLGLKKTIQDGIFA